MPVYRVKYPWWVRLLRKWAGKINGDLEKYARYYTMDGKHCRSPFRS